MNERPKMKNWMLLLIMIIAATVVVLLLTPAPLPSYTGSISSEDVLSKSSDIEIPSFLYQDETLAFSMKIPEDWDKVIKDGFVTFVHAPSVSSFQFQTLGYDPNVNHTTEESIRTQVQNAGCQFISFSKISSSSYLTVYLKPGKEESGGTVYFETTTWDIQHILRIVGTLKEQNFDRMKETIMYSLDSFHWEKESPIPENIYLCYNPVGSFEFGVPLDWATGIAGNSFVAQNKENGAIFTVSVQETKNPIQELSQLQYSESLSQGRSNFLMKAFEKSDGMIYSESLYQSEETRYVLLQYFVERGQYQYVLSFECPADADTSAANIFKTCLSFFRTF